MECPHCGKPIADDWILKAAGEITGMRLVKERGAKYFREIQAKRKIRAGGRPRKRK
jgi:hypothetical protein